MCVKFNSLTTRRESPMRKPKREDQVYGSNVVIGIFVGLALLVILVSNLSGDGKFVMAVVLISSAWQPHIHS